MPVEKARITFFNIDQFGLYKHGDTTPVVGDVADALDDLMSWSGGKDLAQTVTYQVSSSSQLMPSYLFDIRKKGGTYLITIWNEVPSTQGSVASVDPNSSVGSVSVTMNPLKRGTIPGFATYFWFVPSLSVFASVQFQHSLVGRKELQKYVEGYLDPISKYVTFSSKKGGFKVVKYVDGSGVEHDKLHSKFKSSVVRKPGDIQHVLSNHAKIERVIRRTTLEMKNQQQKDVMDKLVGLVKRAKKINYTLPVNPVSISYEMPLHLNYSDLNAIIDDWNKTNNHSRAEWDDYGFQLQGEMNKTYWLSSSLARDKFDLDVTRVNAEVVDGGSLLDALSNKKPTITSIL
ncbi:hypothetical protein [Halomonas mongoliensis]|uniref:hypothetical protein n=1 Tax=Halomonas mongoliensis TaxID=321265 RepID=UPI00403AF64E